MENTASSDTIDTPRQITPAKRWWAQYKFAAMLGVLLLIALALRVPRADAGLPYLHFWDEPFIMNSAVNIVKTGNLNPIYQNYPGGYMNLQAVVASISMVQLAKAKLLGSPANVLTGFDTLYLWTSTHPYLYYNARLVTALLSVFLIGLTYKLTTLFFSRTAALVAAALMVVSPAVAENSVLVTTDIPSAVAVALCLLTCTLMMQRKISPMRGAVCAGIFTGMAFGMKYNAVIVGVAYLCAHVLYHRNKSLNLPLLWWVLCAGLAFIVVSPGALLDYTQFVTSLMHQVSSYSNRGGFNETASSWSNFGLYVKEFCTIGFGLPAMLLAVVGGYLCTRSRTSATLPLLVFLAVYLLVFSRMKIHFFRNMMPVMPIVAMFAGGSIDWLVRCCKGLKIPYVPCLVAGGLALAVFLPAKEQYRSFMHNSFHRTDNRVAAVDYLHTRVRDASDKILWDSSLYLVASALKKDGRDLYRNIIFDNAHRWTPEMLRARNVKFVVTPLKYEKAETQGAGADLAAEALNRRFSALPVAATWKGTPLTYARCPVSPGINIYEVNDAPAITPWGDTVPGLAFDGGGDRLLNFDNGAQELYFEGQLSYDFETSAPVTGLTLWMGGYWVYPHFPIVNITCENLEDRNKNLTLAHRLQVTGYNVAIPYDFKTVIPEGKWRITIAPTNPSERVPLTKGEKVRAVGIQLLQMNSNS